MVEKGCAASAQDLDLGAVRVRPQERLLESAAASVTVEPLVMQLFLALSRRAGHLVTRRELFDWCWGSAAVGDDSLNRLVAVLRKALHQVAGDGVAIETVAGAGYVLRLGSSGPPPGEAAARLLQAAHDSWRLHLPEPDHLRLELLRAACRADPSNAQLWGSLALLCRHAAEYAEPAHAAAFVAECEEAARHALAIAPHQPRARTALASVAPLFGRWLDARTRLAAIVAGNGHDPVAAHDLAIVEMTTGRVRAAKALMDRLIAADPLAACFCYKSIYQHWSVGDRPGMDDVADRAIQLWPTHPAVWTARLWTLGYSGRARAALAMLDDGVARPPVPPPMLAFLRGVLGAAASGGPASAAIDAGRTLAAAGPAQAVASMFALGLLGAGSDLFAVAEAYYLREGAHPVPLRHTPHEISVNEQHRRVTQVLFTPIFAAVRGDPRFLTLCDRIGLSRYWDASGLAPDFISARTEACAQG